MASEKRKPISQEAAAKIVGGEDGGGGHTHDPCTYQYCDCECTHYACGGCTCGSQTAVGNHPHVSA